MHDSKNLEVDCFLLSKMAKVSSTYGFYNCGSTAKSNNYFHLRKVTIYLLASCNTDCIINFGGLLKVIFMIANENICQNWAHWTAHSDTIDLSMHCVGEAEFNQTLF